jgi:hypothetical protein
MMIKASNTRPIGLPSPDGADGFETFSDHGTGRATAHLTAIDRCLQPDSRIDVAIEER